MVVTGREIRLVLFGVESNRVQGRALLDLSLEWNNFIQKPTVIYIMLEIIAEYILSPFPSLTMPCCPLSPIAPVKAPIFLTRNITGRMLEPMRGMINTRTLTSTLPLSLTFL